MKRPCAVKFSGPPTGALTPKLRSCCMAAQGLWMEMLCLMHEAEPCGYLTLNGKPVTDRRLASLAGASVKGVCVALGLKNPAYSAVTRIARYSLGAFCAMWRKRRRIRRTEKRAATRRLARG